jgi:prevent-host-death family protein
MRSVNIADLKNQLSAYLHRVRAGEELLIRDRNIPIAKISPLQEDDAEGDELSLVASGQMTLPKKSFREDRFWAIGSRKAKTPDLRAAIRRAISAEREERNAGLLGHKRHRAHLRSRTSKRRS